MTFRPTVEVPHQNSRPFDCPCRRCSTRRQDRLDAEADGINWREDPSLKLDHEEIAVLEAEAEAKKKAYQAFHDATDGEIARELERSKQQYQRDRVVIDAFAKAHPEIAQTPDNADHLLGWIRKNAKGVISRENLESAYQAVKGQIEYLELLGTLPNGEPEISLKSDVFELKRASKEQLKNWMARKRLQEAQQRQGVQ